MATKAKHGQTVFSGRLHLKTPPLREFCLDWPIILNLAVIGGPWPARSALSSKPDPIPFVLHTRKVPTPFHGAVCGPRPASSPAQGSNASGSADAALLAEPTSSTPAVSSVRAGMAFTAPSLPLVRARQRSWVWRPQHRQLQLRRQPQCL